MYYSSDSDLDEVDELGMGTSVSDKNDGVEPRLLIRHKVIYTLINMCMYQWYDRCILGTFLINPEIKQLQHHAIYEYSLQCTC